MSKPTLLPAQVNRKQVLARYWDLACLDPEITKGNITGQLKALDALCEELKPAGGEPRVPRVSGVYRAAWLEDANLEQ
jgi:hypothetical protein